jgi:hypothetical protein
MRRRWPTDAVWMVGIVGALCAVSIAVGERIGINGGQGWDGMAYTAWAEDFSGRVLVEHLTRYHSQRVLPSAIVYYALRALGRPTDAGHVIAGFQLLDVAMLMLAAGLWAQLGAALSWRRAARWVGFVALFAGFANARHALYYPTLTDPTAFALGMVLIWGYATDRRWAVWLAGLSGTLTWPALPPVAIVLLALPRTPAALSCAPAPPWARPRLVTALAVVAAAIGTALFLGIAHNYLLHPVPGVGDDKFAAWVRRDLLVLTVPGLVAMLGAGWFVLLRDPRLLDARMLRRSARDWAWTAAAIASLVSVRLAWVGAIGTRGEGPSGAQFLCEHTLSAIRGPLWGPVHHVVYFGPIIAVAALAWPRLARAAGDLGPGAVIALALTLGFAAGSNTRQWNHLLPLLVALTIAATEPLWTPRRALLFTALALAWSRLWMTIGYDRHIAWWEFPNQRYFMTQGPYASDAMYLVHLVAAAASTLALALLLRGPAPCAPVAADSTPGARPR